MNFFSNTPTPIVNKLELKKKYDFMYENFVFSTQHELYLLLQEKEGIIDALKFKFNTYKYGYPNDEAIGAHPMAQFGLKWYDLFEVENSPWIQEIMKANRVHPMHNDNLFNGYKHYIVSFKDVTLDVMAINPFEEIILTTTELLNLVKQQVLSLKIE